ncbi:MAG TPA: hypothetical protein VFV89_07085 [Nocardioides sp.]|nr:hypothetical protein [Nocardioides sp.]HEX5087554.1 hypothetical protein [Nocardioides sp.]
MRSKSVRLTVAGLVAVLSVLGLSQTSADAKVINHHHVSKVGPSWCC